MYGTIQMHFGKMVYMTHNNAKTWTADELRQMSEHLLKTAAQLDKLNAALETP